LSAFNREVISCPERTRVRPPPAMQFRCRIDRGIEQSNWDPSNEQI
jgi:hypothetical protein